MLSLHINVARKGSDLNCLDRVQHFLQIRFLHAHIFIAQNQMQKTPLKHTQEANLVLSGTKKDIKGKRFVDLFSFVFHLGVCLFTRLAVYLFAILLSCCFIVLLVCYCFFFCFGFCIVGTTHDFILRFFVFVYIYLV